MRTRKTVLQFTRVFLIFIAMCLISIVKAFVYPTNSLLTIKSFSNVSTTNVYSKSVDEFVLSRYIEGAEDTQDNYNIVYQVEKCDVYYDGKKLISFTADIFDESITPPWLLNRFEDIDLDYMKKNDYLDYYLFEYYSAEMLLYFDEDKPYGVKLKDIHKQSESELLTFALEKFISNGCWDYFEYGCEYLLKYDSEFIIPYINRYADADFTDNELELNTHINQQYMIDLSAEMKDKYL